MLKMMYNEAMPNVKVGNSYDFSMDDTTDHDGGRHSDTLDPQTLNPKPLKPGSWRSSIKSPGTQQKMMEFQRNGGSWARPSLGGSGN